MNDAPPRPSWWRRRVVGPIVAQLRQGIAPEQIALTLAVGGALGVFPILGTTTLLCAVAGVWLRLNAALMQLVNYLVYPLQLLLLIPFCRAGERLFGAAPVPLADVPALVARFGADPGQFALDYGRVLLYGAAAWSLVAPPLVLLLYAVLKPALRSLRSSVAARRPPGGG